MARPPRQFARRGHTDFRRHDNCFTWLGDPALAQRLMDQQMYDKAANVLRAETTIANTADFKAFRPLQDDPHGRLAWRPLRKGIADLHRRA